MIDKQRADFISAYENHVVNSHKDLYLLKNRLTEIANDKAREEKIQKLYKEKAFIKRKL